MKTIKMIAVLAALMGVFTLKANAQSATSFDYTGVTAADFAPDEYGVWVSGVGAPTGAVWPSAQAGVLGIAQQFTIKQPTDISALDTSVVVYQPPQGYDETTLTWGIYSGTTIEELNSNFYPNNPIPLISSLVAQSVPIIYYSPVTSETQTVMEQIPFDVDLQPGTYWIAEMGTGDAAVVPSQTYIDPSGGAAPVPEPPTLLLFGIGMFLFVIRTYFFPMSIFRFLAPPI